jgi:hypothetical protein
MCISLPDIPASYPAPTFPYDPPPNARAFPFPSARPRLRVGAVIYIESGKSRRPTPGGQWALGASGSTFRPYARDRGVARCDYARHKNLECHETLCKQHAVRVCTYHGTTWCTEITHQRAIFRSQSGMHSVPRRRLPPRLGNFDFPGSAQLIKHEHLGHHDP